MTTPNNGGAAFPALNFIVPHDLAEAGVRRLGETQGMTKREAFALAALPACYAEYFAGLARGEYRCEPEWRDGVAVEAFRMADAMLAARKEES